MSSVKFSSCCSCCFEPIVRLFLPRETTEMFRHFVFTIRTTQTYFSCTIDVISFIYCMVPKQVITTKRTAAPLASPTHKNNWLIKEQLPGHFRNPIMESEAVCILISFYNILIF